jgi:hypothetical protein
MSYDEEWPDQSIQERLAIVRKTIRAVSLDELRNLGETLFPIVSDPWCEKFHEFIKANASGRFYRADLPNDAQLVYCADANKGIWFLPGGQAVGVIQPKGLLSLAGIVNAL